MDYDLVALIVYVVFVVLIGVVVVVVTLSDGGRVSTGVVTRRGTSVHDAAGRHRDRPRYRWGTRSAFGMVLVIAVIAFIVMSMVPLDDLYSSPAYALSIPCLVGCLFGATALLVWMLASRVSLSLFLRRISRDPDSVAVRVHDALGSRTLSSEEARRVRPLIAQFMIGDRGIVPQYSLHVVDCPTVNGIVWGGESWGLHFVITDGALANLDDRELSGLVANLVTRVGSLDSPTLETLLSIAGAGSWHAEHARDKGVQPREALADMRDFDAETVLLMRDPATLTRALLRAREIGSELAFLEDEIIHPSLCFCWPYGGEEEVEQISVRVQCLHRLQEVRSV